MNEKLSHEQFDKDRVLDSLQDLKQEIEKKKTSPDIVKDLRELHASLEKHEDTLLFAKAEKLLQRIENSETKDTYDESIQKLIALKTEIPHSTISSTMQRPTVNYDAMSEADITHIAQQERKASASNVQRIVDQSRFVPNRLKKLTA